jgi:hypothetical protein
VTQDVEVNTGLATIVLPRFNRNYFFSQISCLLTYLLILTMYHTMVYTVTPFNITFKLIVWLCRFVLRIPYRIRKIKKTIGKKIKKIFRTLDRYRDRHYSRGIFDILDPSIVHRLSTTTERSFMIHQYDTLESLGSRICVVHYSGRKRHYTDVYRAYRVHDTLDYVKIFRFSSPRDQYVDRIPYAVHYLAIKEWLGD